MRLNVELDLLMEGLEYNNRLEIMSEELGSWTDEAIVELLERIKFYRSEGIAKFVTKHKEDILDSMTDTQFMQLEKSLHTESMKRSEA